MIRRARQTDFSRVCEIYAIARAFMAKTGNATQWGDSFPPEELLREDIRLGRLYVVEEAGNVHGAFAFLLGEDPTYQVIEGGAWKSGAPYGTLHRVAGSGEVRGLFGQMVDYAWGGDPPPAHRHPREQRRDAPPGGKARLSAVRRHLHRRRHPTHRL